MQRHHHGRRSRAAGQSGDHRLAGATQHGEGAVAGFLQLAVVGQRHAGLEHGREIGGLLAREAEIGAAQALECGERARPALVPGSGETLLEALEAAPGDVGHQRVAVAEMPVGRGWTHAGSARGLGEGEPRRALLGDEVEGGADQRLAQVAVVIAAPPAAAVAMPAHG